MWFVKNRVVILHKPRWSATHAFCEGFTIHKSQCAYSQNSCVLLALCLFEMFVPSARLMAPKKRTSGGASGGGKKAKTDTTSIASIPPDAKHLQHMALFDDWVSSGPH